MLTGCPRPLVAALREGISRDDDPVGTAMRTIIDGYNLLHASGIMGRGLGPGGLERSRRALLNVLAASLTADQLVDTTVVFDASDAPPGLPRTQQHEELTVVYAADHEDADALIEEMIAHDSAPKRLTVVSSDHRIQRAARRRKSTAVDSRPWYDELVRQRRQRVKTGAAPPDKPVLPPTAGEVAYWMDEFATPEVNAPAGEEPHAGIRRDDSPADPPRPDGPFPQDPFPPGYFDDLEDELQEG